MNQAQNKFYVLGIDLGTSSCKSVVLNLSGEILGSGSSEYTAVDIHSKWQEQNPDLLLKATIVSARNALNSAGATKNGCLGLSVGGALHSLLALNKHGHPLTGIITWADNRATGQVIDLEISWDMHHHYMTAGCPNHPMYPLSKIIWLREERFDIFKKVRQFISAKEYLLHKLTGEHVVDVSIASGTSLLNVNDLSWDERALEMAEIQPEQLSKICDPRTKLNLSDPSLADQLGIPVNTPVFVGSSDAVNSNLGTGAVTEHQLTCMVGSSGAIRKITRQPILDSEERTWCYAVDFDHWLVGGAINNGGLALQWLQHALSQGSVQETLSGHPTLEDILTWAEQVIPGSDGLICLPFFTGERSPNWNANARAVFFGLTIEHDQRHIARAVLEGIGYRLLSVLDALDEVAGKTSEIRASGGYTQSPFWLQLTADILNRDIHTVENSESSAVGAAYWAMIGNDLIDSFESVCNLVENRSTYKPDTQVRETYYESFQIYQSLYCQLEDLYNETAT